MTPTEDSRANADDKRSGLARGVRKGMQVAALAAALVPLGSIPVTSTDQLIGSPRAADAQPGFINRTVGAPLCDGAEGGVEGTALAVVPGGKAGFPTRPTLLLTSGFNASGAPVLCLSDPSGANATIVKSIPTIFPSAATAASKPTAGWEAVALRTDKGDILACGTNGTKTVLWSIDFSPFNTIADGSATFLRNGPTGSSCDSIAWDSSDGTVYQTPASGFSVFHFKNDGTALSPIVVPHAAADVCNPNTAITGLGIAGTSLFVACSDTSSSASIGSSHPSVAARRGATPLTARAGRLRDRGHIRLAALDPGGSSMVLAGSPLPTFTAIAQLYKVNGSLVRSFPGPSSVPTLFGVPDDPATLGSAFTELLWTLTDSGNFVAFEMAGGTLGQKAGPPAPFPGSCPAAFGGNVSSNGDGLLDCWKNGALWSDGKPGINYAGTYSLNANPLGAAPRDVTLCVTPAGAVFNQTTDCAQPNRKDLFVEVDYMDFHKPDTGAGTAIDAVIQMFANAPAPPGSVTLHVQVDDLVVVNGKNHYTNIAFVPCTAAASPNDTTTVDFDVVKKAFFGTSAERTANATNPNVLNAKALAYRYGVMAHNLLGLGTTSGCAEIGGNDFIVSLGSWTSRIATGKSVSHGIGTLDQLSGTFGHEFGHTLGLRHGGGDSLNCKSNYVSIMNYNNQFLLPAQRVLDYSRQPLLQLDRTQLDENQGVGTFTGPPLNIVFGTVAQLAQPNVVLVPSGGAIDWDKSGTFTTVSRDISQTTGATGGCPLAQKGALPDNPDGNLLKPFNDWANLQFNFRSSVDFADGGHVTSGETALTDPQNDTPPGITLETAAALSGAAFFPITVDFKPGDPNNNVNRKGDQDVEVVIFSATGFDATTIVPGSLFLVGDGWSVPVRVKGNGEFYCDERDAHRKDHLDDLVCKFKIPKNTVGAGETQIFVIGATSADPPQPVGTTVPITVHP